MSTTDLVPDAPDMKAQHEDTGLGGSIAAEGQVKHSMRGLVFLLGLAACIVVIAVFAATTIGR